MTDGIHPRLLPRQTGIGQNHLAYVGGGRRNSNPIHAATKPDDRISTRTVCGASAHLLAYDAEGNRVLVYDAHHPQACKNCNAILRKRGVNLEPYEVIDGRDPEAMRDALRRHQNGEGTLSIAHSPLPGEPSVVFQPNERAHR